MLEIKYKRYYPKGFFSSNNEKLGVVSISEQLSRAIIIHTLNIDEDRIVQGRPEKKQPDYIIDHQNGLEVTFAASSSTVQNILQGRLNAADIEHEVISSIINACNRKREKVLDGLYSSVQHSSLFLLELDPIFPWYQQYYGEIDKRLYQKRDDLFAKLYVEYIQNGIFSNIYLLIITELENYFLFSIKEFMERHTIDRWMQEIRIVDKTILPYYKATSFAQTGDYTIHYIIEDVIWF